MIEFLRQLFSSDFMGHGYCYLWKPDIIWLHAVSDGLIALAYYVIPVTLVYFVRKRRDLPFHWMFFMFGMFIFGCGTTHAMEIWTLWHGTYRLAGVIKAFTAAASIATGVALVQLVPRALLLPSPGQLSAANLELEKEIGERRKTEIALRESEERFRNMADTAPVMIWVAGPDKLCTFFNKCCLDFTGHSLDQKIGNGWIGGVHPEDREQFLGMYSSSFDARQEFQVVFRLRRADGEYRWMLTTGAPRWTSDGVFAGFIGSCVDITDLKRSQEEALARQKLESLGVLARGVAHDFNNLLGGITASAELALMERAEGSAVEEHLQRINTTSIRGAEIVRELMIYGGEESSVFEPVDISALVNEMLQLLKVSISKPTTLKTELGQNLPPVHANPAQIRQVVMNLVTNASEAIGTRAGEIRVTSGKVRVGPNSPVRGSVTLTEGEYLRLEIVDSGSGMTPEVQARIFDPFFSTKRVGRGLGLAAVQGIIRSHGGTINVESASGLGSRFEILLPFVDQAAQDPRDITAVPLAREAGSATGTVLVVEDEEMLRIAVSKMLRKQGFAVIEAGDGTTGVKLFRASERDIDVVLLDFTLPEMSGREVLEELRGIRPNVKVIFTSAFSQDEILSSISQEHFWGYIRKPYQVSELTSQLRIACLDKPTISGNAAS